MSEKHTPGPWTSYPCNLEKYSRVITAKGAMVQVAYTGLEHSDQVAMTKEVYGDRMTYGPGEETAANARLIAAAPDLLSALNGAIEHWPVPSSICKDRHAYEAARAAIAKATGEQA